MTDIDGQGSLVIDVVKLYWCAVEPHYDDVTPKAKLAALYPIFVIKVAIGKEADITTAGPVTIELKDELW